MAHSHTNGVSSATEVRHLNLLCDSPRKKNLALIQLNTPLPEDEIKFFRQLWSDASVVASVDGAINLLYDSSCLNRKDFIPKLITGDFDSARPDVLEFYRQEGSSVISTPDQNETDFTKCVSVVMKHVEREKLSVDTIVAYMSHQSKRFDHLMASINTLYTTAKTFPQSFLCLYSKSCLTFLINSGKTILHFPPRYNHLKCGLLPIGRQCEHVTTTGLRWNLNEGKLEFGGMVSSSNEIDSESGTVSIVTSHPFVWTMTFCET